MKLPAINLGLDTKSWKQIAIHSAIVAGAAVTAYLVQHMGADDFGTWTPVIMAAASVILKYLQKALQEDTPGIHSLAAGDPNSWKNSAKDD